MWGRLHHEKVQSAVIWDCPGHLASPWVTKWQMSLLVREMACSCSFSCAWITECCLCRTWLTSAVYISPNVFSSPESSGISAGLQSARWKTQEGRRKWEAKCNYCLHPAFQSHLHFSPSELFVNILRILPTTRYFQEELTTQKRKGKQNFSYLIPESSPYYILENECFAFYLFLWLLWTLKIHLI